MNYLQKSLMFLTVLLVNFSVEAQIINYVANEELLHLSTIGDLSGIRTLMRTNIVIDVNYSPVFDATNGQPLGDTPLMRAINGEHVDVVKFLISKGANVDYKQSDTQTPLSLAAQLGNVEIVNALIEGGATDLNVPGARTPLMHACIFGYPNVVQVLINAGADVVYVRSSYGINETALSLARENRWRHDEDAHTAIIEMLTEAGAN